MALSEPSAPSPGISYGVTRFPVVVHVVDPNIVDRSLCRYRLAYHVPAQMLEQLGLCYACSQILAKGSELEKAS